MYYGGRLVCALCGMFLKQERVGVLYCIMGEGWCEHYEGCF